MPRPSGICKTQNYGRSQVCTRDNQSRICLKMPSGHRMCDAPEAWVVSLQALPTNPSSEDPFDASCATPGQSTPLYITDYHSNRYKQSVQSLLHRHRSRKIVPDSAHPGKELCSCRGEHRPVSGPHRTLNAQWCRLNEPFRQVHGVDNLLLRSLLQICDAHAREVNK